MKAHERDVAAIARAAGLAVVRPRRRGHLHLVDSDGHLIVVASSTPRRPDMALRQLRADVRRYAPTPTKEAP